jgi:hypothetical protein
MLLEALFKLIAVKTHVMGNGKSKAIPRFEFKKVAEPAPGKPARAERKTLRHHRSSW